MRSTLVILLVAGVVGPIAYWQYGAGGVFVVATATATIVISMWLAAWCAHWFARDGRTGMGLLAATGVRMVLPLALVLGLVTLGRGQIEPRSVLYVLPLYLAMLIVDTVASMRRIRSSQGDPIPVPNPSDKAVGNQG